MRLKFLYGLTMLGIAFAILFVSIFSSAAVRYEFSGDVHTDMSNFEDTMVIDYYLADPGNVLPNSPLWLVKVLRDKVWFFSTTDDAREAELNLLFADKRLASSIILFQNGDPELGYVTLLKAEKYLIEANQMAIENRKAGMDTSEFLQRLNKASLKHAYEIDALKLLSPEDAIPKIVETMNYPKIVYFDTSEELARFGIRVTYNPFNWHK